MTGYEPEEEEKEEARAFMLCIAKLFLPICVYQFMRLDRIMSYSILYLCISIYVIK